MLENENLISHISYERKTQLKYKIEKPKPDPSNFTPYNVILTIENETDARVFHDFFAIKVSKSGNFIGDVYRAKTGESYGKEGEVLLEPSI